MVGDHRALVISKDLPTQQKRRQLKLTYCALGCTHTEKCVELNCGTFGKKCHNNVFCTCSTNPYSALAVQNQRQTIKVWHISYQNAVHIFYKLVALFLTCTILLPMITIRIQDRDPHTSGFRIVIHTRAR